MASRSSTTAKRSRWKGKDDPDNRRDFPGGFPGDARNAFESRRANAKRAKACTSGRATGYELRREHSALRQGRLIDLFYDDDAYVFARQDRSETVIIAINRSKKEKKVTIPAGAIGLKDGAELATFDWNGWAAVASRTAVQP